MATTVDTCGLSCPQPVLLFLEAVKGGAEDICVLVDNDTSRENVTRAAHNKGFSVAAQPSQNGVVTLVITK